MVVKLRPQAAEDIAEVWEHIAEDNFAAADRWVDQLGEQFRLLATQPLMGRARNELSPRLRSFPCRAPVAFCARCGSDVRGLEHVVSHNK